MNLFRCLLILLSGILPFPLTAKTYLTKNEALTLAFENPLETRARELSWSTAQHQAMEKQLDDTIPFRTLTLYTGRMKSEKGAGIAVFDAVIGKHELIDYMVLMGKDGRVRWIEILSYRESYGEQIRDKTWRDQFKSASSDALPEHGHNISNISGATLSCRHVTEGVRRILVVLSFFQKDLGLDVQTKE